MVWIYGGVFRLGSAATGLYDGERLARKGVVFVSMNYRVGPFGYLSHPDLAREPSITRPVTTRCSIRSPR